jgi:CSLREA domain-containing protein
MTKPQGCSLRGGIRAVLPAGLALLLLAITPAAAGAATITVTTTADEFTDPGPGTGCALREAVQASNTDATFGGCATGVDGVDDTIALTSGMTYGLTIPDTGDDDTNANGDLDFSGTESATVTTTGSGQATIDANGDGVGEAVATNDRVFHTTPTAGAITLDNLVITDGNTVNESGGLRHDTAAVLTITGSRIAGNQTAGIGGAMRLGFSATITDSTISGNTAGTVGGIWISTGVLDVSRSTISGNVANGNSMSSNGNAGGLFVSGGGAASATLKNSTISGNQANGNGGGIFTFGPVTLANATVADNRADNDGAGMFAGDGGGVFIQGIAGASLTTRNSIIADNLDLSTAGNNHPDCSGTITSQLYNLIGSAPPGSCTGIDPMDDLQGFSGVTEPLADNGGPTETRALPAGSPAIDAGNPATPGSGGTACEATDQRGQSRLGPAEPCDIGAYEVPVPAAPVLTGTTPASPANDNNPEVFGTAEAGSTVSLYDNGTCTPPAAFTGPAALFASPGFTATVPDNSTTNFSATATGSGGTSACSTMNVAYTEVTPPPPTGGGTTPPALTPPPVATGQRAAALKKCKKKKSARARRNCKKRAKKLPV